MGTKCRQNPTIRPLLVNPGSREPKAYLVVAQPWDRGLPMTEASVLGLFYSETEAQERAERWVQDYPAG